MDKPKNLACIEKCQKIAANLGVAGRNQQTEDLSPPFKAFGAIGGTPLMVNIFPLVAIGTVGIWLPVVRQGVHFALQSQSSSEKVGIHTTRAIS